MASFWVPLESNPQVLTKFIHTLGVSKDWSFTDIWSLDDEMLPMIPQPIKALLLLFPITEKYEEASALQKEQLLKQGHPESLYFCKQTIGNACGAIAVLHAIANNRTEISLGNGDLALFIQNTISLSAEERASALGKNEALRNAHATSAEQGQTEAPDAESDVDLHFVCLLHHNGFLYELDGRKVHPVRHGPTSYNAFIEDAAQLVKKNWIEQNPDQVQFTLMGLVPTDALID